jgi:phenylpyruvate tautomerase PptA (4-oxalocrotonate tautomerase family)
MPVHTCTIAESTLTTETKAILAAAITDIHAEINHVPGTYVNVVFNELPQANVYTGAKPSQPLLINGWSPFCDTDKWDPRVSAFCRSEGGDYRP